MAIRRLGHEVLFHYRALAAAGDDLAVRIIKGIEVIGVKPDYMCEVTSVRRRDVLARYIAAPSAEGYRQLLAEVTKLGWNGWRSESFNRTPVGEIQPHDYGPNTALAQWWFNLPDDAL